jgi:hypothetical protein
VVAARRVAIQCRQYSVREGVVTLDGLIVAAANIAITVRMSATRPYRHGWRIRAWRAGGE